MAFGNEFPSSAVLRKDRHDLAQSREPDLGLKFAEQEIKSASPAVRLQADNRRTIFLLLDGANDQSKFDEFGLAVHTIYQEKLSGEAKPLVPYKQFYCISYQSLGNRAYLVQLVVFVVASRLTTMAKARKQEPM